jgi:hypothetical protein
MFPEECGGLYPKQSALSNEIFKIFFMSASGSAIKYAFVMRIDILLKSIK